MAVDTISIIGRNTPGVKLMDIDVESDIRVASIAKVRESSSSDDSEESEELEEDENSYQDPTLQE